MSFSANIQTKWDSKISLALLQGEHSAILSTFIKLPFIIKIFVLSIFEWPFYTCFTVAIGAAVDDDSLAVIRSMRICGYFCLL